ncbi:MAG: CBS domain-containing protein [Desulforegulaceae bacterium]|nr:CBS domain-containing protein [Desulforegulaceae bacterium]
MKISEFMTTDVISCNVDKTLKDAADLMLEKNISVLPVVDSDNKLLGILTESDFVGKDANIPRAMASIRMLFGKTAYRGNIEKIYREVKDHPLDKVMTKDPVTISADSSLTALVELMGNRNLKRIPVVKDKKLVGIVTRKDLIKAFSMVK